jgi:MoxR-like ATPase
MPVSPPQPPLELRNALQGAMTQIQRVVLGKEFAVRQAFACLLARGHLLIEDLPGVGKTTLAHSIAKSLGLQYQRIQFTSDLLPADILGASVFDRNSGSFVFHPGPVFVNLVLADEINRATPKAQSALLEAMEERQVTVEGETRTLPQPFFVIATQNPSDQHGTFPLPESQLDRFAMRISLGYPDRQAERALLAGGDRRDLLEGIEPNLSTEDLVAAQNAVLAIHVSEQMLDYLQELLARSRESNRGRVGLSPRSGLSLLRCGQAWALLEGRDFLMPEDIQAVLKAVVEHRLGDVDTGLTALVEDPVEMLLNAVPVP